MQRAGGGNVIEKVNSLGDKILKSTSSTLHLTALTVKSTPRDIDRVVTVTTLMSIEYGDK